jgi:predicted nuclease of predicted toxin-antitoxin system
MIRLYMDVHVPEAISRTLRQRGVDVLTAQEDGTTRLPDGALLDRATALQRVLFSEDKDLLREAAARQRGGGDFAGVIYIHRRDVNIGRCSEELELIAAIYTSEEMSNRVQYLPL